MRLQAAQADYGWGIGSTNLLLSYSVAGIGALALAMVLRRVAQHAGAGPAELEPAMAGLLKKGADGATHAELAVLNAELALPRYGNTRIGGLSSSGQVECAWAAGADNWPGWPNGSGVCADRRHSVCRSQE